VPQLGTATLVDDRTGNDSRVFLDLELGQQTPTDTFTVDVLWADDALGHKSESTYTVHCAQVSTEPGCLTGSFGNGSTPANANWSQLPLFSLPIDQNFLPYVTVKITNGYGAEVVRTFPIVGESRAKYTDRTPIVTMVVGRSSDVPITTVHPSTLLDDPTLSLSNVLDQIVPRLPPGVTPYLTGPDASGFYTIGVTGRPESKDIGPWTFYFPVDQLQLENGVHISVPDSRPPPAQVTLDVVAKATPGFRGLLWNLPSGGVSTNVREAWPLWGVRVPYSRPPGADPADDPVFAGPVVCDLKRDGHAVTGFPQLCPQDAPFPWPGDLTDGSYEASVTAIRPLELGPDVDGSTNTRQFNAVILRPTLTRQAGTGTTDTLALAVEDYYGNPFGKVAPPFSPKGYQVTCRFDGAAAVPCLDGGTQTVLRTPGAHSVSVLVTSPDGATMERALGWAVDTPPTALGVAAPRKVKAGRSFTVDVSGLLPTETFTVVFGGRSYVGTASSAGAGSVTIKVGKKAKAGKQKVAVAGATAQRAGSDTIKVVKKKRRRKPH
jgi:hypothetical protein